MPINVLVVDDSGVMRSMIIKSLKMCELPLGRIYQAEDGEKGLAVLKENWVNLVIVDINMPVMNGEEMIDHMKQDKEMKNIPIIVISTEGSESRLNRLKETGAAFIHKPFTPEMIRDTISTLIN